MLIAAPHIKQNQRNELFQALAALDKNAGLFWDSFEPAPQHKVEQLHLDQIKSVEALKTLIDEY